jgi:hypothetical protein
MRSWRRLPSSPRWCRKSRSLHEPLAPTPASWVGGCERFAPSVGSSSAIWCGSRRGEGRPLAMGRRLASSRGSVLDRRLLCQRSVRDGAARARREPHPRVRNVVACRRRLALHERAGYAAAPGTARRIVQRRPGCRGRAAAISLLRRRATCAMRRWTALGRTVGSRYRSSASTLHSTVSDFADDGTCSHRPQRREPNGTASLKLDSDPLGSQFLNDLADALE